jgi:uncharacterized damage-inducible protein DinB
MQRGGDLQMSISLSLNDLMDYTDWERQKWYEWLQHHGDQVLKIGAGPHGDGRFQSVGELMRHIFSAEKRYVERLSGRSLTDPASIPTDSIEGLFQFSRQSRKELKELVETFPAQKWDVPEELKFPNLNIIGRATPRKIVTHVVMHEIRHWAQIATLFRLQGLAVDFHDFLASPVMGGEFRRDQNKA